MLPVSVMSDCVFLYCTLHSLYCALHSIVLGWGWAQLRFIFTLALLLHSLQPVLGPTHSAQHLEGENVKIRIFHSAGQYPEPAIIP